MTSRIPRLWKPGSVRPRVFLPDFWIKLLEWSDVGIYRLPKYAAVFEVDPRMSRFDIREYLEKIYKLPVRDVRTFNREGEITWQWPKDPRNRRALWKEEDRKLAYVFFKKDYIIEFPAMFSTTDDIDRQIEESRKTLKQVPTTINERYVNRDRAGVGRLLP